MEKQKYMKASDVALRFGVTRQTIRNWVKKRLLHAITLDGAQYVTMESIEKIDGCFVDLSLLEGTIEHYKKSLEVVEKRYKESVSELRDCCNGNQAIKNSRQTLAKFLPVFYNIIQPDIIANDRGFQILSMLFDGKDIKEISEKFNLTTARIQQIIDAELCKLHKNTQTYQMLKEQNDKLLNENKAMKINARSFESLKLETKEVKKSKPNILTRKINSFDFLSVRALNSCYYNGIETISDLVALHKTDVLKWRTVGKKTLVELDGLVKHCGLEWGKHYLVTEDGKVIEAITTT